MRKILVFLMVFACFALIGCTTMSIQEGKKALKEGRPREAKKIAKKIMEDSDSAVQDKRKAAKLLVQSEIAQENFKSALLDVSRSLKNYPEDCECLSLAANLATRLYQNTGKCSLNEQS